MNVSRDRVRRKIEQRRNSFWKTWRVFRILLNVEWLRLFERCYGMAVNEHETSRILRHRWQIGGMVNNTKLFETFYDIPLLTRDLIKPVESNVRRTMDRAVYSTRARRKFVETDLMRGVRQRSNDVSVIHRLLWKNRPFVNPLIN